MNTQNHSHEPLIPRMIQEIKKTFLGEPHTLPEVSASLRDAELNETDFIYLLKHHHDFLQESISVLMNTNASDYDKQWHCSRFLHLLSMHGRAEEETLYRNLKNCDEKESRIEGQAAQNEHDLAFQLSDELYGMGFEDAWSEEIGAKAKVLAGLVANHIREEESIMFPLAERTLEESQLNGLLKEYIYKCEGYLEIEMRPGYRV